MIFLFLADVVYVDADCEDEGTDDIDEVKTYGHKK